jgi:Na+-driven multidrug efflux pump
VSRVAVTGVAFNFLSGGALIAIIYVLNRHALGLFLPVDGAAIEIATHLNKVVLWSFVLFGMSMVLFGVVRATGAVMPPLFILVLSLWCVRLPFAYSLIGSWQAEAIWWSFPVASVTSLIMAIAYYRFGGWRKLRLGVAEAVAAPAPSV